MRHFKTSDCRANKYSDRKTSMPYSEQIKDPSWKKRQQHIVERDEFTCKSSGEKDKLLSIHRVLIFNDLLIWDYQVKALISYCGNCNKEILNSAVEIMKIVEFNCECPHAAKTLVELIDFVSYLNNQGVYDKGLQRYRRGTNRKGLPDILATYKRMSLMIEVKAGKDRLSEDQKEVRQEQELSGGLFFVAHNFTEFKAWFDNF